MSVKNVVVQGMKERALQQKGNIPFTIVLRIGIVRTVGMIGKIIFLHLIMHTKNYEGEPSPQHTQTKN